MYIDRSQKSVNGVLELVNKGISSGVGWGGVGRSIHSYPDIDSAPLGTHSCLAGRYLSDEKNNVIGRLYLIGLTCSITATYAVFVSLI